LIKFIKYTGASAIALLVDYGSYLVLLSLTLHSPEVLATISYLLGLGVAYVLMKHLVFNFKNQLSIKAECFRFLLSGLIGRITTYFTTKISMWVYPYPEIVQVSGCWCEFLCGLFIQKSVRL